MRSNNKRIEKPRFECRNWGLYAILDEAFLRGRQAGMLAEQICRGGASVIQYRNKTGDRAIMRKRITAIRSVTRRYGIPFILNDDVETALEAGAEGVHVGKDDMTPERVRKMAGEHFIIGYSVQKSETLKRSAGADYLGVGALFPTETHSNYPVMGLEMAAEIRKLTTLPMIGIGGITLKTIGPVIRAGCDGVAVISALLNDVDTQKKTAELVHEIGRAKREKYHRES